MRLDVAAGRDDDVVAVGQAGRDVVAARNRRCRIEAALKQQRRSVRLDQLVRAVVHVRHAEQGALGDVTLGVVEDQPLVHLRHVQVDLVQRRDRVVGAGDGQVHHPGDAGIGVVLGERGGEGRIVALAQLVDNRRHLGVAARDVQVDEQGVHGQHVVHLQRHGDAFAGGERVRRRIRLQVARACASAPAGSG